MSSPRRLASSLYNVRRFGRRGCPPQASAASTGRRRRRPPAHACATAGAPRRGHPEARFCGDQSWFRGETAAEQPEQEYTIDDLIVLERYDEAERAPARQDQAQPQRPALAPEAGRGLHPAPAVRQGGGRVRLRRRGVRPGRLPRQGDRPALQGAEAGAARPVAALQGRAAPAREEHGARARASPSKGCARPAAARPAPRPWSSSGSGTTWPPARSCSACTGEQLKRLFSAMELVRFEPRTLLAQEGSRDAFLLLIVIGVVEAFVGGRRPRHGRAQLHLGRHRRRRRRCSSAAPGRPTTGPRSRSPP